MHGDGISTLKATPATLFVAFLDGQTVGIVDTIIGDAYQALLKEGHHHDVCGVLLPCTSA